jgi:hypothetical protein
MTSARSLREHDRHRASDEMKKPPSLGKLSSHLRGPMEVGAYRSSRAGNSAHQRSVESSPVATSIPLTVSRSKLIADPSPRDHALNLLIDIEGGVEIGR